MNGRENRLRSLLLSCAAIGACLLSLTAHSAMAADTQTAVTNPADPIAVFDTSLGQIRCELFPKESPQTVANFIGLATGTKQWTDPTDGSKRTNKPFYDGTIFHRVIPGFMIQGGDPLGTGMGGPGFTINDENPNLHFDRAGRLAMANTGQANSAGSQFFITTDPRPDLDVNGHYTIFGQVISGQSVVHEISIVARDGNDKPLRDVVLKSLTIENPNK